MRDLIWVEYYPEIILGGESDPEHWDATNFDLEIPSLHFRRARWWRLTKEQVTALKDGRWPEAPKGQSFRAMAKVVGVPCWGREKLELLICEECHSWVSGGGSLDLGTATTATEQGSS